MLAAGLRAQPHRTTPAPEPKPYVWYHPQAEGRWLEALISSGERPEVQARVVIQRRPCCVSPRLSSGRTELSFGYSSAEAALADVLRAQLHRPAAGPEPTRYLSYHPGLQASRFYGGRSMSRWMRPNIRFGFGPGTGAMWLSS